MWISRKRLKELMKDQYQFGYSRGFKDGRDYVVRELLRWRKILESSRQPDIVRQVEQILKEKGFGNG